MTDVVQIVATAAALKLDTEAAVRSVADGLAMTLYGKRYGTSVYGALGQKQVILAKKNNLRGRKFVVCVSKAIADAPETKSPPRYLKRNKTYSRHYDQILRDITAMVSHATTESLDFTVV